MIGKHWGRYTRASVQLKIELGRPASKEEIRELLSSDASKDAFNVTPEQIDEHYLQGYDVSNFT